MTEWAVKKGQVQRDGKTVSAKNIVEEIERLRQTLFCALRRVKQLGKDVESSVFDRRMDKWYADFLETCSFEQKAEIEAADAMSRILGCFHRDYGSCDALGTDGRCSECERLGKTTEPTGAGEVPY